MPALTCATCKQPVSVVNGIPASHKCFHDSVGLRVHKSVKIRKNWEATEAALYAALRLRYHELGSNSDALWPEFVDSILNCWIRQYPWGAYLNPPRKFSSDAGFPVARLLVEVDGGAHGAGKDKVKTDTLRRGLAAAAGWRVLSVLPAQVYDGTAISLVNAALNGGSK